SEGAAASLAIYSGESGGDDWTLHVTGSISRQGGSGIVPEDEALQGEGKTTSGNDHYQQMRDKGLAYGPAFRGVEFLTCFDRNTSAAIRVPREIAPTMALFRMHPAILDAALQVLTTALAVDSELYIPIAMDRVRLLGPAEALMAVHTRLIHYGPDTLS